MAGGVTTLAAVNEILKEVYESRIQDQLQSEVITLRRIERTSEGITSEVGGKYVTFPLRTQRNHGIGARLENEVLPVAQSQKYASARVSLSYLYGAVSITGQTMELADKNFQAFASALQQEMDGLKQNLAKDMNRQTYGTSDGILAVITPGANSATQTFGTATPGLGQYLEPGMLVDFYDPTYATLRGTKTILSVDTVAGTFVVDSAVNTTTLDVVERSGSRQRELIGFKQIVAASGTVYNVNPATVPVWKATVNSNSGTNRALSESLMIKLVDDIRTVSGQTPTVIFTTLGVRRSYFNLLVQQRRYTDNKEFAGGFKGLAFTTDTGDIPLMSDFDCQANRLYFLNEKQLKFYREGEWSFMNRDGSMWQRVMDSAGSYDAYQAMMFLYGQLGTHQRNAHGLLSDITES